MSDGGAMNVTRHSYQDCTQVSDFCPVEATVLGYYPNLGSSIFFAIAFGLCTIASIVLGVWKRTWSYATGLTIGLVLETVGYVGRALLHSNPWNSSAFQIQICTIILAPTFICVSIYLTLKHIALNLNPAASRVTPKWYPRFFLPADLSCLIVQAIGGGIAAAAGHTDRTLQQAGNHAIIAGVALQVVVLLLFGVMGVDYWVRARRYIHGPDADPQALALWNDPKFRKFGVAVGIAFSAVLIRCIYRIAEMAGGWGNHIMQDEPSFLVLDSSLVLVTAYLLTVFHPGIFFPQMRNDSPENRAAKEERKRAKADKKAAKQEKKATRKSKGGDSSPLEAATDSADSSNEVKVEPA